MSAGSCSNHSEIVRDSIFYLFGLVFGLMSEKLIMILYVDRIISPNIGGFTYDLKKAAYIFATQGYTIKELLSHCSKNAKIPTGMMPIGEYIAVYNIAWDLSRVAVGFIKYNISLDENFDHFADLLTPKSVAGFHMLQEELRLNKQQQLTIVELSTDDIPF